MGTGAAGPSSPGPAGGRAAAEAEGAAAETGRRLTTDATAASTTAATGPPSGRAATAASATAGAAAELAPTLALAGAAAAPPAGAVAHAARRAGGPAISQPRAFAQSTRGPQVRRLLGPCPLAPEGHGRQEGYGALSPRGAESSRTLKFVARRVCLAAAPSCNPMAFAPKFCSPLMFYVGAHSRRSPERLEARERNMIARDWGPASENRARHMIKGKGKDKGKRKGKGKDNKGDAKGKGK